MTFLNFPINSFLLFLQFIVFFHIYKICENLSAKYYQKNEE